MVVDRWRLGYMGNCGLLLIRAPEMRETPLAMTWARDQRLRKARQMRNILIVASSWSKPQPRLPLRFSALFGSDDG